MIRKESSIQVNLTSMIVISRITTRTRTSTKVFRHLAREYSKARVIVGSINFLFRSKVIKIITLKSTLSRKSRIQ